jgi:glutamate--cysteine ligase
VRPRRWLEIRYLDSLPDALWPAVAFMMTTLLDDPEAADLAAETVEPVATAWDTAARVGLADRHLHAAAVRCVEIAADLVPAELSASMQVLVDMVRRGRTAGDDFSDAAVQKGIGAAITDLWQEQL